MMMMAERRTLVLVNLAGIMERADEALLPAVYKEVGAALHATPAGLGALTLYRSLVQSSCYPLAAYMALRYNRTHVVALGALLWAAATFLVAISDTYLQVAIWRGLNGIGLALVTPAIQSLVADSTDDKNRGSAFGWLQLTGSIGSVLGGVVAFQLASTSVLGIAGWRVAFHLVAILSVIIGIMLPLFAVDPNYTNNASRSNGSSICNSLWTEVKDLAKEAKAVMRITSFQIIVVQGVTGSFPWSSLLFAPMWLQLIGFSQNMIGILLILFVAANSLGGLFGGKIGDFLAKRFPNSGRIILSQISTGSAVPLAAVLMLVLPDDPSSGLAHALGFFVLGLSISWTGTATNNPIFAEIVPEKSRTSIYALDRSIESVLSSFAPPVVGLLAQYIYGYKPIPNGSSEDTKVAIDRQNAASLAKALCTAIAVPMALCSILYSFLYCSYPRDREQARMDSLMDPSEMQQIPLEDPCEDGDSFRVQIAESELYQKGRSVIDTVYVGEFGIDNKEETALLPR